MTFRSQAEIRGLTSPVPASTAAPSGHPDAECRLMKFGEDATSDAFNRGPHAVAENTDELRAWINRDIAYPAFVALNAWTGVTAQNTVVIDLDGATGDINLSGQLYLGEPSWSGQEYLDRLFVILDDDNQQPYVDNVPVVINSIGGAAAIGDEFVSTGVINIGLSASLPTGQNWRFFFWERTDIENVDQQAIVNSMFLALKNNFNREIAYGEVGALTGFTGSSIDIDPSGGAAGDVNYTGKLYLGESGWAGQEDLDSLFQLLDENYNEVLVDGTEVKVTSLTGNSIGDDFVITITTLNLNKTLPSGNYRISYCAGTTYDAMPRYALIKSDIRGLQESSAESQILVEKAKTYVTCSPNVGEGDFVGSTAITDAITAHGADTVMYVKAGTYDMPSISVSNVTIEGESNYATILQASGGTVTLSGDRIEFKNLRMEEPGALSTLQINGPYTRLESVVIDDIKIIINQWYCRLDDVFQNITDDRAITISGSYCTIDRCSISVGGTGTTNSDVIRISGDYARISNSRIRTTSASSTRTALHLDDCDLAEFASCDITGQAGPALTYGNASEAVQAKFSSCIFLSDQTVVRPYVIDAVIEAFLTFDSCQFTNTETASWYVGVFCQLLSRGYRIDADSLASGPCGIVLSNCNFIDNWCTGWETGPTPPAVAGTTGNRAVLEFRGVVGTNIKFSRDVDHDIQDTEWVELWYSTIRGFEIGYDVAVGKVYTASVASNGLVRVGSGGTVEDLVVVGFFGKGCDALVSSGVGGGWKRALLYMNGSSLDDDFSGFGGSKAVVDKVSLQQLVSSGEAHEWYRDDGGSPGSPSPLLAYLGDGAILSNLHFSKANRLAMTSGLNRRTPSLITIFGESTVRDCNIYVGNGTNPALTLNGGLLGSVIMVSSCNKATIENNRIKVYNEPDNTANDLYAVIYISGSDRIAVQSNNIDTYITDGIITTGYGIHILVSSTSEVCRIINNHLYSEDLDATNHGHVVIDNTTYGGAVARACIAIGNILVTADPTYDGDILPNTVKGYANNIMINV